MRYKANYCLHRHLHEWLVMHANQAHHNLGKKYSDENCFQLSQRSAHRPAHSTHRPFSDTSKDPTDINLTQFPNYRRRHRHL